MLERYQFTWKVDQSTLIEMRKAKVDDEFNSPDFTGGKLKWGLEAFLNGGTDDERGSFALYLRLISMPSEWKYVECCYQMCCKETHGRLTGSHKFEDYDNWGWDDGILSFRRIQNLNSLTFSVDIFIHKITSNEDGKVLFQKLTSNSPCRIKWAIDEDMLRCIKETRDGQIFESDLYDGVWTLQLEREGDQYGLYLNLHTMPSELQKVQAKWQVKVDFKGTLRSKVRSVRYEFSLEDPGYGNCGLISSKELQKCDSVLVHVDIWAETGGLSLYHWNRSLEKKEDDEKEVQSPNQSLLRAVKALSGKFDRLHGLSSSKDKAMASKLKKFDQQMVSIRSELKEVQHHIDSKNELSQSKLDTLHVSFTEYKNETDSKLDEVARHILSINNQLRAVQQRSASENQQSQSELVLSQITKLTENISSMKRATYQIDLQNTNEVKIWIEHIVKLPQYYNVLTEQGFDDMESVQEMTTDDLREMGIDMIGHRRKIMKKVRELNDGQLDVIAKDIEIQRAKDSMQKVLECVLPQRDESTILWFHQKSNELRVEIVAKHRLDALESKKEEDDEYIPLIRKYIEVNDGADPQNQKAVLCTGEESESSDSAISSQLDIVEKYKVYDHPRLRLENGTFGLRAKKEILAGSVIGEYLGKHWIAQDLETLYGTKLYNDINKYAFEELVEVKMPRERIRYYQRSERMEGGDENEGDEVTEDEDIDMESNHNMREPPRKKQKKNEEQHIFKIVLDGESLKDKALLCFMNDCRQDMRSQKPSKDDKKHLNVRFVSVYHRGWPRIFGVAVKDIEAGEELLSFYGDYSDVLNQDRKLKIMSNKLRTILAPHGLDCLVNQMN